MPAAGEVERKEAGDQGDDAENLKNRFGIDLLSRCQENDDCDTPPDQGEQVPDKSQRAGSEVGPAKEFRQVVALEKANKDVALAKVRMGGASEEEQ